MIKNVFFDLDGTLSDPKIGFMRCLQYALEKMGLPQPEQIDYSKYIGPPLRTSFPKLLGTSDKGLIEKAMSLFRERLTAIGIYENELYLGVTEMLDEISQDSYRLFVVTSRPTVYSEIIVKNLKLNHYFISVFGPELNGRFDDKTELVKHVLENRSLVAAETVMIGDREVDIVAGKSNGTKTIGVTYGYGSEKELLGCVPDHICHSPDQIPALIRDYQSRITIV
jgi:phosphoglycolate phosphatase